MAKFINSGAATGAAVSDSDILIMECLLTAPSSHDCVLTIKGEGSTAIVLAAKAGTSASYPNAASTPVASSRVKGPVTVDITGADAFVRIEF